MTDCDYCGASFDDEDDYADHLGSAHDPDELSRIDRRKATDTAGGYLPDISVGVLALVAVFAVIVGILAASALSGTGADETELAGEVEQEPTSYGERHFHGTITVEVDGEPIDFSQQKYQLQADAVHFEGGDGQKWHSHAEEVTIEYFMATLGIEVGQDTFIHEEAGTEVTPQDDDSVSVLVNGEEVDPSTYELQPDDEIHIVVNTSA